MGVGGSVGPGGSVAAGGAGGVAQTGGSSSECAYDVPLVAGRPLDLYIMLDRSTSMGQPLGGAAGQPTQWAGATLGIQQFVQSRAAAQTRVGLQLFGVPDVCNPQAYATPAAPVEAIPDGVADIIGAMGAVFPTTQRPTYPALQGALEHMAQRAPSHPDRQAAVVLVTDGPPTQCSENQSPKCPNCSLSATALADLARQFAQGSPPVLTFVVGIGEGANLSAVARAGGTADAFVINAGDVQSQVRDALGSIASPPPDCDLPLAPPPNLGTPANLDQISVWVHPAGGPEQLIPRVAGPADCESEPGRGWYAVPPSSPTTIRLCPRACGDIAGGSVAIGVGCPGDAM